MSEKVYTIEEIESKLSEVLDSQPVKKVILFGSYAKDSATPTSDIDLVIDSDGKLRGFALIKLICQIREKFQKELDCFERYEIVPESKVDNEIKDTGVVVYER